jgi:hemoglobin
MLTKFDFITRQRLLAAALALSLAACASSGQNLLYKQLGAQQGVTNIVDAMLKIVLADDRIKDGFKDTNMTRLRRTLIEQFCVVSGGPCTYSGDPMKEVHQGLGINSAGFNALVEDLQSAMDMNGVPSRYQNRLLAKLAPMHRDIVTK